MLKYIAEIYNRIITNFELKIEQNILGQEFEEN